MHVHTYNIWSEAVGRRPPHTNPTPPHRGRGGHVHHPRCSNSKFDSRIYSQPHTNSSPIPTGGGEGYSQPHTHRGDVGIPNPPPAVGRANQPRVIYIILNLARSVNQNGAILRFGPHWHLVGYMLETAPV
jgi:hypothetical protein